MLAQPPPVNQRALSFQTGTTRQVFAGRLARHTPKIRLFAHAA